MNQLDLDYQALLKDILENGVEKKDRTGTGTLSVFGRQIRYKFKDGKFPLLTTKKMAWKTMVTELLWFLRGDTNIKYLVDNGCHIWDGDCFSNYQKVMDRVMTNNLPYIKGFDTEILDEKTDSFWSYNKFIERIKTDSEFAAKWGELGPIYGKQWRRWDNPIVLTDGSGEGWYGEPIDQIANLIRDLKANPDSRRLMVSAWNVGEIDSAVLPPCHYGFQVYTRELSRLERYRHLRKYKYGAKYDVEYGDEMAYYDSIGVPKRAISLMWNQRSVDTPLGLPFNIASYALLLEIVGRMVNMVPDELIGNLGDTHIYLNQVEGINEQLTREPYELPSLRMGKTDDFFKSLSNDLSLITHLDVNDFVVENYKSHPAIKIPLSN
jgi:thymidylate synthase